MAAPSDRRRAGSGRLPGNARETLTRAGASRAGTVGMRESPDIAAFAYSDLLPLGPDTTDYRLVSTEGVSTVDAAGRTFLKVEPEALRC